MGIGGRLLTLSLVFHSVTVPLGLCLSHQRPQQEAAASPGCPQGLLPPVPSGSEADKEQTAEKRRAAQLEAHSSLLTDHKAWEVCSGLTGRNIHCSFCWRGSHASGQVTYSSCSTKSPGALKTAASVATWTGLETVIPSKVNQTEKEKYLVTSLIRGI